MGNVSALNITVACVEDNSQCFIIVAITRFNAATSMPLLSPSSVVAAADATHGVKFWIPYDLNPQLSDGTYKFLRRTVVATNADGSPFADIRINLNLYLPSVTATVNLTTGYISPTYVTPASSAYFLVSDASVGPTVREWWGGDSSNLTVPLISFACNKFVTAIIQGRQRTDCSSSKWQMSAGRGANDCGKIFLLDLYPSNVNTWMVDPNLRGCKFETHPIKPIQITAYRWHDPGAEAVLGRMVLKLALQL
jgi:hypothetical protein